MSQTPAPYRITSERAPRCPECWGYAVDFGGFAAICGKGHSFAYHLETVPVFATYRHKQPFKPDLPPSAPRSAA